MKLAIASDHGGLGLKKSLLDFLVSKKIEYIDLGVSEASSVDYPDYAEKLAVQLQEGKVQGGILLCGTGIGMAMTANKFRGIRAAVVTDAFTARMSKEHNNANVIALGARVLDEKTALIAVETWLESKFQGRRHQRRVDKISEIEHRNFKKEPTR